MPTKPKAAAKSKVPAKAAPTASKKTAPKAKPVAKAKPAVKAKPVAKKPAAPAKSSKPVAPKAKPKKPTGIVQAVKKGVQSGIETVGDLVKKVTPDALLPKAGKPKRK